MYGEPESCGTGLAKAGLTLDEAMAGARGSLALAGAAEVGVAEATDLVASALNSFELPGSRATEVANLFAAAANASQGSTDDFGLSVQQAGAIAHDFGLTVEDTTALLTQYARAGILGSDAGTSLKAGLQRLAAPTKEAAGVMEALGIKIDKTMSIGEQFPDIIEQLRVATADLTPVTRTNALTTLFGADAYRTMSISIREGSAGFEEAKDTITGTNAAIDLMAAKSDGSKGALEGLQSQSETLAVTVGELLTPAVETFAEEAADSVGDVNSLIEAVKDLAGVDLPWWLGGSTPGGRIRDVLGTALDVVVSRVKGGISPVIGILDTAAGAISRFRDEVEKQPGRPFKLLEPPGGSAVTQLIQAAKDSGKKTGEALAGGVAEGIDSRVAEVRAKGKELIEETVRAAQQSLASIGAQIAGDAAAVIDEGPIIERIEEITETQRRAEQARTVSRLRETVRDATQALAVALRNAPVERTIRRLRAELDQATSRDERGDLQRTLRDAREALQSAQRQAQIVGPLTGEQLTQRQRFLRPFREEVQEARGEIGRFNKETTIERLEAKLAGQTDAVAQNITDLRDTVQQARQDLIDSQKAFQERGLLDSLTEMAEEQRKAVQRGIADIVQRFNDGKLTLKQMNTEIAAVLKENDVDYEAAGDVLGTAFVRGFQGALTGPNAQARAILAGPQMPGIGTVPPVTRPTEAVAEARRAEQKVLEEIADDQDTSIDVQKDIRAELRAIRKGNRAPLTPSAAQRGPGGTGGRFSGP